MIILADIDGWRKIIPINDDNYRRGEVTVCIERRMEVSFDVPETPDKLFALTFRLYNTGEKVNGVPLWRCL